MQKKKFRNLFFIKIVDKQNKQYICEFILNYCNFFNIFYRDCSCFYRNLVLRGKNSLKCSIFKLKILVASTKQIRSNSLLKSWDGLFLGRVWSATTVNYKDLKPMSGGLFCESIFGSIRRGICACEQTHWLKYPKIPNKMRRVEIILCGCCLTPTIYSFFDNI